MDSAAAVPDFFTSLDPEPVSEAPGSDRSMCGLWFQLYSTIFSTKTKIWQGTVIIIV